METTPFKATKVTPRQMVAEAATWGTMKWILVAVAVHAVVIAAASIIWPKASASVAGPEQTQAAAPTSKPATAAASIAGTAAKPASNTGDETTLTPEQRNTTVGKALTDTAPAPRATGIKGIELE